MSKIWKLQHLWVVPECSNPIKYAPIMSDYIIVDKVEKFLFWVVILYKFLCDPWTSAKLLLKFYVKSVGYVRMNSIIAYISLCSWKTQKRISVNSQCALNIDDIIRKDNRYCHGCCQCVVMSFIKLNQCDRLTVWRYKVDN